MKNYPVIKKRSVFASIMTILFAILSIVNLIYITTWLSYFTPALFIINLFFAIYWISKRDKMMIIPIIATLTQLFPVTSLFRVDMDIPYGSPSSIKVASYNVGTFKHKGLSTTMEIVAIMQKENVDIVCFQEFVESGDTTDFYKKFSCFPYKCIQDQVSSHTTRLAIFSRYPIVNDQKVIFKNNINSAMAADVDINGTVVRIINCHMQTTGVNQNRRYGNGAAIEGASTNSIIRNEQAKSVCDYIDKSFLPIVLCGDFNDPPLSYTYRVINRKLKDGFKQAGNGYGSTFIGGFKSLLRIDYIFNSRDFECTQYVTPEFVFSDHKPVISTLEYKTRK